ncbi:Tripartite DNA replication factor [Dinochytrium kinnereticum]|nr:Tripartite DNA replication factor [Dinochytrium kinnereticum]
MLHADKKKRLDQNTASSYPCGASPDDTRSKAKLLDLVNSMNSIFQSDRFDDLSLALNEELPIPSLKKGNTASKEGLGRNCSDEDRFLVKIHKRSQSIHIKRLVVLYVTSSEHEKLIEALDVKTSKVYTISLQGEWIQTVVDSGDYIVAHGQFKNNKLTISNAENLLIVDPDTLVSATHLADSFSCMRRSVLQDKSKASSEKSTFLTYGNLLHQLFQSCLNAMNFSTDFICKKIDLMVSQSLVELYDINVSEEVARAYLMQSVPNLQKWAGEFIRKREPDKSKGSATLVTKVLDIEEHIWSPNFGIKGNIDASIVVSKDKGQSFQLMPLELKTGQSAQAVSHRAQTILYTQLMEDRYSAEVTSGLLVYLKTAETIPISASRSDLLGIFLKRNTLARFLKSPTLPPMRSNKHVCKNCFVLDSCLTYRKVYEDNSSEEEGLGELREAFEKRTGHISESRRRFFERWDRVLEGEGRYLGEGRREIWNMNGGKREMVGRCLSNMTPTEATALPASESKMNRYVCIFERAPPPSQPTEDKEVRTGSLLNSNICVGEPVVVSSEDGVYAIALGFVVELSPRFVKLSLDRPVMTTNEEVEQGRGRFRIDKDEMMGGVAKLRGHLINLIVSEEDERRRELIIDLRPPTFQLPGPRIGLNKPNFFLNSDQKRAIAKVAAANDYTMILGMPGTGKTTTIAAMVQILLDLGHTILLAAYTHSAIDNILLKLKTAGIDFLRFGDGNKIHPDIRDFAFDPLKFGSVDELREFVVGKRLVASTCLGVDMAVISSMKFDYCVIDEASQLSLPACLAPLRLARKFVLVGDSYQLPPLIAESLMVGGLRQSDFGIISPYRSQLKLLSYRLMDYASVEILTVDQFQGRDKDCIGDLLRDWRRINVAFSRARSKLIVIGCRVTLASSHLFRELFDLLDSEGWVLEVPHEVLKRLKGVDVV